MKLKSITGSLLAVGALLLANPASADLQILGDYENPPPPLDYDADALRATLGCIGCEGLITNFPSTLDISPDHPISTDADGFSGTVADLFVNEFGGNPENEQDWVNSALAAAGIADTVDLGTKTDSPNTEFCSSAEYVLFKVGSEPNVFLVHNTGTGEVCYDYNSLGEGAGLSHIVEYGGNGTVSEPSILALFGAGLVLLGFLRRRAIV